MDSASGVKFLGGRKAIPNVGLSAGIAQRERRPGAFEPGHAVDTCACAAATAASADEEAEAGTKVPHRFDKFRAGSSTAQHKLRPSSVPSHASRSYFAGRQTVAPTGL
jgi:hypothetical protein